MSSKLSREWKQKILFQSGFRNFLDTQWPLFTRPLYKKWQYRTILFYYRIIHLLYIKHKKVWKQGHSSIGFYPVSANSSRTILVCYEAFFGPKKMSVPLQVLYNGIVPPVAMYSLKRSPIMFYNFSLESNIRKYLTFSNASRCFALVKFETT